MAELSGNRRRRAQGANGLFATPLRTGKADSPKGCPLE
jgi:hypothetical protein